MKVLSGHLTATDKKAIRSILDLNLLSGRVNKKDYFLSLTDGIYTVKQHRKDRGLVPVPGSPFRISVYTSTFTI